MVLSYKILKDLSNNAYVNGIFCKEDRFYLDKNYINNIDELIITNEDDDILNYEIDLENQLETIVSKKKTRSAELLIIHDNLINFGMNPFNINLVKCPEATSVIMIKSSRIYIFLYLVNVDFECKKELNEKSKNINFENNNYIIIRIQECQVYEDDRCEYSTKLTAREDDSSSYVIKCGAQETCFRCFVGNTAVTSYKQYLNWRQNYDEINSESDDDDIVKINC